MTDPAAMPGGPSASSSGTTSPTPPAGQPPTSAPTPNSAPLTPGAGAVTPTFQGVPTGQSGYGGQGGYLGLSGLSGGGPGAGGTLPAAPPASLSLTTPGATLLSLTADKTVALVTQKNLGVLSALRDVFAAQAGVKSAAALSPPIFTIGPAFQTGGTTDGFLFEQPLELNGTRDARAGVARAQLRLTQAQAVVQLQTLVYIARTNFYVLARAQERLRLSRELRDVTAQFAALAQKQADLGARPGIEARQAAIEAARARAEESRALGEEQAARAVLNAYLGRAPLDPVATSLAPVEASRTLPVPDTVAATKQALAARGEIAVAEATRDVPLARARLARAQGRPDVAPEFRIAQITPTYMDAGFGVVFTVPLDYGTRRNQIRQEERIAEAELLRVTGTQAQVREEVAAAASRLAAAREVLSGYDSGLVQDARTVLDSVQTGFKEGATTIIAVLEAERTYRVVTSERLDALTTAAQAQSEFDRAVGVVPAPLLEQLRKDWNHK